MEKCIICGTTLYFGSGICFDCELKEKEERHNTNVPKEENVQELSDTGVQD